MPHFLISKIYIKCQIICHLSKEFATWSWYLFWNRVQICLQQCIINHPINCEW
jgi:hypothetical protein